jgi:hypothetical protein
MKIIKLNVVAILLLMNNIVSAQFQEKPVNLQSPNASSLSQYKEIPVSYFTGVPSINVPIYTLKTSQSPISINLSYHAAGFKPDMHPGWVGLNWNLSVGGMISRKVNDIPDEYDNTHYPKLGFFYQYQMLDNINWASAAYAKTIGSNSQQFSKDTEPDEFSFNFFNYSGKFYLDEKGKWQVKCDYSLKVIFNNTFTYPPFSAPQGYNYFTSYNNGKFMQSFSGFTLLTEDGTQYVFGGTSDETEYSINMFAQQQASWLANTWNLKQIIYTSGKKVNFTYERIADAYNGKFICSMYESVYYKSYIKKKTGNSLLDVSCSFNPIGLPYNGIYGGELISPVYLKSIETDLEKIEFEKSPSTELKYSPAIFFNVMNVSPPKKGDYFLPYLETHWSEVEKYLPHDTVELNKTLNRMVWQKLDKIKIINKTSNQKYKEFSLNYNNKIDERLILTSIQEADSTALLKNPPYQFLYDYKFMQAANKLPPYILSRQMDHWGYYNSTEAIPSLIDNYYNKRKPTGLYPSVGILSKLVYPTGGSTYFQYEDHNYKKAVPENRSQDLLTYNNDEIAGGIRIKSIVDSGNFTPNDFIQRNYIYKQNYAPLADLQQLPSSGVLGGQSKYFWDEYISQASNNPDVSYYQKVFSSNSVLPASNNSMGSHIGYTEITEKLANKGYIKYKFSNFDTDNGANKDELAILNLQPTRTSYEPYNSKENKRGNLQSKEYYDSSGVLVKKETFEYITLLAGKFIRALKAYNESICGVSDIINIGVAYKHYLENEKIKKHTTYDYANNTLVSSEEFTYDDYKNIIAEKFVGSKQDTILIEYKYPYNFPTPPVDLSPCLTEYLSCKNECKVYSKDKYEMMLCYDDCNAGKTSCEQQLVNNANKNNVYAKMVGKNMISNIIEKKIYNVKNGLKYLTQAELNTYKEFYNNKIFKETIYLYESLIPKEAGTVINTTYTTKLNFDPAYKVYSKYNYDTAGNLIQRNKLNDVVINYIYDYANTLPIAECTNATELDIAATSFEADNKGNFSFAGQPTADATAITGKKVYNLNAGLITKINLNPAKTYVVTYWSKSGAQNVNGIAGTAYTTKNGWTLYKHEIVNPPAQAITVSGTGTIDELRLYPEESQMNTYTYEPLIGITSQCDANNKITYYKYDDFNRLSYILDQDKNIIKKISYNYAGQPEN